MYQRRGMMGGMRVISGLLGAALLLLTSGSVLRTLVLLRGLTSRAMKLVWQPWRRLLLLLAAGTRRYERRDRLLAWLGPLALISTLLIWLVGMFAGYGLLMHAFSGLPWRTSFREAGSSLFTLGFASTDRLQLSAVDFAAAATGPLVVALQISYLPTL